MTRRALSGYRVLFGNWLVGRDCHVIVFGMSKRNQSSEARNGKPPDRDPESIAANQFSKSDSLRSPYRRLEDVVGCKWSAAVLAAIGRGVTRPGQIERFVPGISRKVLNERLKKLLDFRLITRTEIPSAVPHTEYALTETGERLCQIIESIRDLDEDHNNQVTDNP
ncbi:MAG TPA: helix-turn-helix domain-containing protein [Pirellulaceae bacterium]|nr:helix-turn-helix domain-containing protein [Pirellulaceae bacterium]HMO91817.1 helix-turn-helix domain-containing protein [Pirellulaceae bacterium]HMP69880.1 helix-turn-helix domain-containing protein [Pirellulaceae bacterium]